MNILGFIVAIWLGAAFLILAVCYLIDRRPPINSWQKLSLAGLVVCAMLFFAPLVLGIHYSRPILAGIIVAAFATYLPMAWHMSGKFGSRTRLARIVAAVICLVALDAVSVKTPPSQVVRTMFLTMQEDGSLRGPTNEIASVSSAAAVQAVLDDNDAINAVASNNYRFASEQLPDLAAAINEPLTTAWMTVEIDLSTEAGSNVQARCVCMGASTNADGTLSLPVWFSLQPNLAPVVPFSATDEDGQEWDMQEVSNSFPATVSVQVGEDLFDCYVYTVQIPDALRSMSLSYQSTIPFGGSNTNQPFEILGGLMPNGKLPRTGYIPVTSNAWFRYEGGLCVGVTNAP